MKTQKQFKICGIAILILGIIHCCATPIVLPSLKVLPSADFLACAYMFVCTGLAVIFIGWLQYYIAKQAEINSKDLNIMRMSVFFMFITGIGAVATMWTNPFAYIILFIALYEIILLRNLAVLPKNL